jgi:hypothetical protein
VAWKLDPRTLEIVRQVGEEPVEVLYRRSSEP